MKRWLTPSRIPASWVREDVLDLGFRDICTNPASRAHQRVCFDMFGPPEAYVVGAEVQSPTCGTSSPTRPCEEG